jgi:hypothetical protein
MGTGFLNMHTIPTTIVDDFFDNPDAVAEYASTLDFSENNGHHPGFRTKNLQDIAPDLYQSVLERFAALFTNEDTAMECVMHFQKNAPDYGLGVPHVDGCCTTGLIYLNKGISNCGTSFFANTKSGFPDLMGEQKRQVISGDRDISEYQEIAKKVRENVEETVNVKARYNRLLTFDGSEIHAENDFDTGAEDRLTLIFFIRDWKIANPPIRRLKTSHWF